MPRTEWQKNLTVDKRIVRLLSTKTYEDFPGAIRELVSNAYDADATEVKITVDVAGDIVEVSDNGNGMTPEDFDFFLRIAGQQRGKQTSPELGRMRIGQFGIGFLALFPFGKRIKIKSTARRSDAFFEANIPAERYFREGGRTIDIEEIPIPGYQLRDPKLVETHGTTVSVVGLGELVQRFFRRRGSPIKASRETVRSWKPLEQLKWFLEEDLPIDYLPGSTYEDAFADLGSVGMKVFLNGEELHRNAPGSIVLENSSWQGGAVQCRYTIATDWKSVKPVENRYLKQRVRNVGIGERSSFGLGLEGRAYSRLHWLTGEIRILGGLDNLITIDRQRFIEGPEYDLFKEYFRGRLGYFARHVETIAEAERDIKRQLSSSRASEVGPTREVIQRNLEKLKSKGFEIVEKASSPGGRNRAAVTVDVKRRKVEIVEDHSALLDQIAVGKRILPIRYSSWPLNDRLSAVRWSTDKVIEINNRYPVFKSRRYGEVFKRALIMMLLLSEEVKTPGELLRKFSAWLVDEFPETQ